jgi:hypothetical protein
LQMGRRASAGELIAHRAIFFALFREAGDFLTHDDDNMNACGSILRVFAGGLTALTIMF